MVVICHSACSLGNLQHFYVPSRVYHRKCSGALLVDLVVFQQFQRLQNNYITLVEEAQVEQAVSMLCLPQLKPNLVPQEFFFR